MYSRTVGIVWGTAGVMAVTLLGCSGPHVVSAISTPTPVSLWPGIYFPGLGPVLICVDRAPSTQHASQNVAGGVGVAAPTTQVPEAQVFAWVFPSGGIWTSWHGTGAIPGVT